MLADELDFVIGVDSHRDAHALAFVSARRAHCSPRPSFRQARPATGARSRSPSGSRLLAASGRSRARAATAPA